MVFKNSIKKNIFWMWCFSLSLFALLPLSLSCLFAFFYLSFPFSLSVCWQIFYWNLFSIWEFMQHTSLHELHCKCVRVFSHLHVTRSQMCLHRMGGIYGRIRRLLPNFFCHLPLFYFITLSRRSSSPAAHLLLWIFIRNPIWENSRLTV